MEKATKIEEWEELANLGMEMMSAGKETKDGMTYMTGAKIIRILTSLKSRIKNGRDRAIAEEQQAEEHRDLVLDGR